MIRIILAAAMSLFLMSCGPAKEQTKDNNAAGTQNQNYLASGMSKEDFESMLTCQVSPLSGSKTHFLYAGWNKFKKQTQGNVIEDASFYVVISLTSKTAKENAGRYEIFFSEELFISDQITKKNLISGTWKWVGGQLVLGSTAAIVPAEVEGKIIPILIFTRDIQSKGLQGIATKLNIDSSEKSFPTEMSCSL